MSSAHKKVIVRRFIGDTLAGYLPLSGFVRSLPSGRTIDLLDLTGRVVSLPLSDIKHICYVRDFNLNDTANPERLTRRTFLARPRTEGLWLRLTFRGEETDPFEGLAPIDATILDDMLNDAGLFLTPPDTRSNTQRIYVPRAAVTELQLLAVITTPSRRKPLPSSSLPSLQEDLFNAPLPPNTRPN
ncbi:DUF6982 domain-containing protein [Edaphobacter bradus]|uniref:DUF6982 domain-containing protein n=1 Tax=Edaphobacter bradus TaxID=2259016 RepID=UPI0021E0C5DA|nr:hypothetical protein [Edaphobacter bradus]